jgi:hypothetical protein
MICRCPIHGLQGCALTSPDALSVAPPGDTSNLLLVFLLDAGRLEYPVTLTGQFAHQYGIVGETADYEEVFVHSDWFLKLVSMCNACFTDRWPELIERYQNWLALNEAAS